MTPRTYDFNRDQLLARLINDLGYPVINRLRIDQIEFLIQHQHMHELVRQHLVHSLMTANLSEEAGQ